MKLKIALVALAAAVLLTLPSGAAETSKPIKLAGSDFIAPKVGAPVDVAPFGEVRSWNDGTDVGVMWEDSRDIFKVVVKFADGVAPPDPSTVKLQYFRIAWPIVRSPRDQLLGSGSSGWMGAGDWYGGHWETADVDINIDGNTWTYTFRPINIKEFPDLKDFDATYRSAMKLRLLFPGKAPAMMGFHAFTDSAWQQTTAVVEWGGTASTKQIWDGKVEAFNGYISYVRPIIGSRVHMTGDKSWTSTVKGNIDGIVLSVWCIKPATVFTFDDTIITVRAKEHSFSFLTKNLMPPDYKPIFIRDFGVLVKGAEDLATYQQAEQQYQKSQKTLYQQVSQMPEQTLSHAWSDMPKKGIVYMPLAVEGGRQHFMVSPEGHVGINKQWLERIKSTDTGKTKWTGTYLYVRVHMASEGGAAGAYLEDDYLPIPTTWYEKDGIRCAEEAFATVLSGKLPPEGRIKAEEPQVLMVKIKATNTGKDTKKFAVPLDVWTSGAEPIQMEDGVIYGNPPEGKFPRFRIDANDAKVTMAEKQVTCEVELAPGESKEFYLAVPYLTPGNPDEVAMLKNLKYNEQHKMMADYWRKRINQGCTITTPEPMLNAFYASNASHQLINTENEVGTDERAMAKVGTFAYGVYTNESVMMTTELDRRGYSDVAQKAYEAWLHYQGTAALPGDYTTADGEFYGAKGYEQGGYNQHHGWAMWGMAEHYWFTRDKAWLNKAAPNLIKACDWITTQRSRTKTSQWCGIRAIEYGLLPPGSLEDIGDWRCWLSNNAFSYWGMENVARALADIGHPQAKRLLAEAAAYKHDIRKAFFEAMLRSPVVSLRDGTFIPSMPSEVHRRGRSLGWITETLEGSIHMIRCGLIAPDEKAAEWIMKDYEDNRYLSQQFGYQIADFDKLWFSQGGFSQQPSLLCSPTPYLLRDQPKHYLRSYFNAFAAGYFPERAMLTEHPLPNLGDFRGDHFKSSDEAMNTSWIRWMFVWDEDNKDLYLGKMIPRYWLADGKKIGITRAYTHFGPMSMSMQSFASKGRIEMTIEPPIRNKPGTIYARFRHPEGKLMKRVTVNGKAYKKFDPKKEWVILPALTAKTVVVAYY